MATHEPEDMNENDSLSHLNKQLYARKETDEILMRRQELSSVGKGRRVEKQEADTQVEATPSLVSVEDLRVKKRRRLLISGGIVALVLLVFIGSVFATYQFRVSRQIQQEQIVILVEAPEVVTSGDAASFIVSYENRSRVDWQSVEVVVDVPEEFIVESTEPSSEHTGSEYIIRVGSVPAGEGGKFELKGIVIGQEGAKVAVQAEITLSPENFPSGRFSATQLASTTLAAIPVEASIEAAQQGGHGERIPLTVHLRNLDDERQENLYVALLPDPGVQLAVEDEAYTPGFSVADSAWNLAPMDPLAEATRVAVLHVEGQAGEKRAVEVEVGIIRDGKKLPQRTVRHVITMVASELTVEQLFQGSSDPVVVSAGEAVKGTIRFRNSGTVGLRNLVVRTQFEGVGLDPSTLKLPQGAYDPTSRTITWTSVSVPALALLQPNQSAELSYEFSMLPVDKLPVTGDDVKNFLLVANAAVDSTDLITPTSGERKIASDRSVISLRTNVLLEASAFYDDGRLGLTSTGPLPPRVNETTTYTVRVRLGTSSNDVGDVRVQTALPEGVKYSGAHVVTAGEISFDERSGTVLWTVPQMEASTGRQRPPLEMHIQVAITPGENVRGLEVPLVALLRAEAQDLFTDEQVSAQVSELPTTRTADREKGVVE